MSPFVREESWALLSPVPVVLVKAADCPQPQAPGCCCSDSRGSSGVAQAEVRSGEQGLRAVGAGLMP